MTLDRCPKRSLGASSAWRSDRVIASGGIAAIEDLIALTDIAAAGANLGGVIVGQALYAGRFTLAEALAATRRPA